MMQFLLGADKNKGTELMSSWRLGVVALGITTLMSATGSCASTTPANVGSITTSPSPSTSTFVPTGGVPGVVGRYRSSVTEDRAISFQRDTPRAWTLEDHVAFAALDWQQHELTVYFKSGATPEDRRRVKSDMTSACPLQSI